jgi:peptide/nickel transport system permease protein
MTWWQKLWCNPLARFGGIILICLYLSVIFADFVTPFSPNLAAKNGALLPPTQIYWHDNQGNFTGGHVYPTTQGIIDLDTGDRELVVDFNKPSRIRLLHSGHLYDTIGEGQLHLLGTDEQGRDQLARLLHGGRISLFIGIIGTTISFAIGSVVGGISGYFGGWIDLVLMRLVEVLMSVPSIYLLIGLAAILPERLSNTQRFLLIISIISFVQWAGLARVIRGQVMSIKQEPFVMAAQSTGASNLRIILRHILPQTASYIIISATLAIPGFTIAESVLSLIGLGIQPPDPSWGNMLSLATNASIIVLHPWLVWSPALLLILTVLSFNLLGDGLRDALDPKSFRS